MMSFLFVPSQVILAREFLLAPTNKFASSCERILSSSSDLVKWWKFLTIVGLDMNFQRSHRLEALLTSFSWTAQISVACVLCDHVMLELLLLLTFLATKIANQFSHHQMTSSKMAVNCRSCSRKFHAHGTLDSITFCFSLYSFEVPEKQVVLQLLNVTDAVVAVITRVSLDLQMNVFVVFLELSLWSKFFQTGPTLLLRSFLFLANFFKDCEITQLSLNFQCSSLMKISSAVLANNSFATEGRAVDL